MTLDLLAKVNRWKRMAAMARETGPSLATTPSLYAAIPILAPKYSAPVHLDPLVRRLEASLTDPVRVTAHAPPRHGKTDTVLAFIAYALHRRPELTLAYVTYERTMAASKSRKARNWARVLGVTPTPDADNLHEWRTRQGGGLLATGIGGPLTGHGVDIMIIDDPYKNREQAESAAYKAMVADWWGDVAETRIEPNGSCFIFHTRWVLDDLIGHVTTSEDGGTWENLVMPALDDQNRPLWPERWTWTELAAKRRSVGEYTWASLYQGQPRSRGTTLFGAPHYYDSLPDGYRVVIGLDFAYTKNTYSDYSVAVVVAEAAGKHYVVDVLRCQAKVPRFAARLQALSRQYPGAELVGYVGGTERGVVDLINAAENLEIRGKPAVADKFVRAQGCAAAWNGGDILVPRTASWLADYLAEMQAFTGVLDDHDDQVDATVSAYDALQTAQYGGIFRVRSNRR